MPPWEKRSKSMREKGLYVMLNAIGTGSNKKDVPLWLSGMKQNGNADD